MAKINKNYLENKYVIRFNKKDPIFYSWFITKFINNLMSNGKKSKVESSMFNAFSYLKIKYKKNPQLLFFLILQKIKPIINVKLVGFGKKRFIIPIILPLIKQYKLAIKWLAISIKHRPEQSLEQKIISEFSNILDNKLTECLKKRNLIYFQASKNKHLINY